MQNIEKKKRKGARRAKKPKRKVVREKPKKKDKGMKKQLFFVA
jgi:hypothetical protein